MPKSKNSKGALSLTSECNALLGRLLSLPNIDPSSLWESMGYSDTTFARIRSDLARGAMTSYTNPVLLKKLRACAAVIEGIQRSAPRRETVREYRLRVMDEIRSLCNGSVHTLVCIPPPLESEFGDVREEVIRAARRGVRFRYYFPGKDWYEKARNRFERIPARPDVVDASQGTDYGRTIEESKRKDLLQAKAFGDTFEWFRHTQRRLESLMNDFAITARELDIREKKDSVGKDKDGRQVWRGPHVDAAGARIVFRPMDWVPLSFRSKVVWISSPMGRTEDAPEWAENTAGRDKEPDPMNDGTVMTWQHIIREELLTPSEDTRYRGLYDFDQIWTNISDPYDPVSLRALIRQAASRESTDGRLVDVRIPQWVETRPFEKPERTEESVGQ